MTDAVGSRPATAPVRFGHLDKMPPCENLPHVSRERLIARQMTGIVERERLGRPPFQQPRRDQLNDVAHARGEGDGSRAVLGALLEELRVVPQKGSARWA